MADGGGGEPAAKRQKAWHVVSSVKAKNTTNPIRKIVDKIVASKKDIPGKKMIPFMLGDPTAFGNLFVPQVFVDALCRVAQSKKANGYGNSVGLDPAVLDAVVETCVDSVPRGPPLPRPIRFLTARTRQPTFSLRAGARAHLRSQSTA